MTTKENILSTLQLHKPELHKLGVLTIGLFGSYVRDEQSDSSDIDILIDFIPEKENFDNLMALNEYMATLFENENVDIVTKNGLSPHIGPFILKEVVYA